MKSPSNPIIWRILTAGMNSEISGDETKLCHHIGTDEHGHRARTFIRFLAYNLNCAGGSDHPEPTGILSFDEAVPRLSSKVVVLAGRESGM